MGGRDSGKVYNGGVAGYIVGEWVGTEWKSERVGGWDSGRVCEYIVREWVGI